MGKGYGSQMMRQALDKCFSDPTVTAVLIDPLASNTRAHKFYEKMGFEFVEERWFDEDRCFVYRIEREKWD